MLPEIQRHKESTTEKVSTLPLLSGILTGCTVVERWTRSFQVPTSFPNTQLFYFRDKSLFMVGGGTEEKLVG